MPAQFRPPHHAVAERGLKYIGVVAELDREPALLLVGKQVVEGGSEHRSLLAIEDRDNAVLVAGEIDQRFAVALRQLGEVKRF